MLEALQAFIWVPFFFLSSLTSNQIRLSFSLVSPPHLELFGAYYWCKNHKTLHTHLVSWFSIINSFPSLGLLLTLFRCFSVDDVTGFLQSLKLYSATARNFLCLGTNSWRFCILKYYRGVVGHAFNPSLDWSRGKWISEFVTTLVYRVNSRTVNAMQRNPDQKHQKIKYLTVLGITFMTLCKHSANRDTFPASDFAF